MKSQLFFLFLLSSTVLSAQNTDSILIKQVDSLIQVSRDLANKQDFEKALELNVNVEKLVLETLGQETASYGSACFNHGRIMHLKKDYVESEKWYLKSKELREKYLTKKHPDYALNLIELANLYFDMGKYKSSESLYLEAQIIQEEVLGKESLAYSKNLINLGILYSTIGQYEKAEPLYIESKAIREKVLGKDHPDYATSLNNLAFLYFDMKQFEKAEPLYIESKTIREKVLGKEHPDYSWSLFNMANLYYALGKYKKAEIFYKDALYYKRKNISLAIYHLSEYEMQQYLLTFENQVERISSYAQEIIQSSEMTQICYDNTLFFKGFLLNAYNQSKLLILSDTVAIEKNNLLKSYGRRLAVEYSKPILDRKGVTELEEKSNTIEKELARTIKGYGDAMKQVNWREVQQKLKANEVAIEFVHYRYFDNKPTDSIMYAALILKPGDSQTKFIPLFEEKSIDSLLRTNAERKADYVNNLYTLADRGAKPIESPIRSLYEILWQPLEKELVGVKKIYYSPTGLLHRINLDAIATSSTKTLADQYQLIELNSTRQLVIPSQVKIANNEAVLYGGIQYDQDSSLLNPEPLITSRSRGELSFKYIDSTLRGGSWNYLPATEDEVNTIGTMMMASGLDIKTKKGYQATEESFKNIGANNSPSPKILHIATHGYFFPDPKINSNVSGFENQKEPVFKMSEHPMLRSGLIMAGGN